MEPTFQPGDALLVVDVQRDFCAGGALAVPERETCPFEETPREKGAHWVKPALVGEVGFTEWTRDGKLRHPHFLGLREDKSPKRVRRERARPAPARES